MKRELVNDSELFKMLCRIRDGLCVVEEQAREITEQDLFGTRNLWDRVYNSTM